MQLYADRIAGEGKAINAVVTLALEHAFARAKEADDALAGGASWGPLHGVPITVKDSFDVADLPSTFGRPSNCSNGPRKMYFNSQYAMALPLARTRPMFCANCTHP